MKFLRGSGVAMITPFNLEGKVDFEAVVKIVNHIISGGIDYIVVMGTTSETATLYEEERSKVISLIVETTKNRVPLVLGLGGNNTAEVVSKITLTDLSPFKAILSVCPYYTKPSQEGIYQHYRNIVNASSIPLILYNVPSRSGVSIEIETTVRLANDFSNIIGTKDASGNLESVIELLKNVPEGFHVISGDDALALPIVLAGGSGSISVIGGGFPTQVSQMISLALEEQIDQASEYHNQMLEMIDLIFEEGNPTGIKSLCGHIGLCSSNVRLPLVSATPELSRSILNLYSQIK